MRLFQWIYKPALRWVLTHRWITLTAAAILFVGAVVLASGIGSEFMPPLNEGDIMFMPIADPSISLAQNTDFAKRQNAVLEKTAKDTARAIAAFYEAYLKKSRS